MAGILIRVSPKLLTSPIRGTYPDKAVCIPHTRIISSKKTFTVFVVRPLPSNFLAETIADTPDLIREFFFQQNPSTRRCAVLVIGVLF